jgi:hypothetical protein
VPAFGPRDQARFGFELNPYNSFLAVAPVCCNRRSSGRKKAPGDFLFQVARTTNNLLANRAMTPARLRRTGGFTVFQQPLVTLLGALDLRFGPGARL